MRVDRRTCVAFALRHDQRLGTEWETPAARHFPCVRADRMSLFRRILIAALACVPLACTSGNVRPDASSDVTVRPALGCTLPIDEPTSAIDFGRRAVTCALDDARMPSEFVVTTADDDRARRALPPAFALLPSRDESFVIYSSAGTTWIVGRDLTGAMYGALDLAERIRIDGARTLPVTTPIVRSPSVPIRGANLFVVLPVRGESAWWFRDVSFWREYLDMLARARINFLDLHGMYSTDNSQFGNVLMHFGTSATYASVGIPAVEREANLAMLNRIIAMAGVRGMRVGLLTYRTDINVDGSGERTTLSPDQIRTYTREAVEDLARRTVGLWRVGFRIGEGGHASALWYLDTFIGAVRAANPSIQIYARTWQADPAQVLEVARAAGGDVILESKYNGEQLGPPYVVAGGDFAGRWVRYSYEGYLDAPGPYRLVLQVRAGGTHRIFRHASFDLARRAARTFTHGGAAGFTLEPPHAYFPQRDYYHANADDRFSPWAFRRDEITYYLYGRLAYDPETPERVFREIFRARVGTDDLWDPMQAASRIVPWTHSAHSCGPDHRDFAAELEWGGPVSYWSTPRYTPSGPNDGACAGHHGPYDTFALAGADETAADLVVGRGTSRVRPQDVARLLLDAARAARVANTVQIDSQNAEARDVVRECAALADLGEYTGWKLRASTALAVYRRTNDDGYLALARVETSRADDAWRALALHTDSIAPFDDTIRMWGLGMHPFHWRLRAAMLDDDRASIDRVVADVRATPPVFTGILPPAQAWLDAARAQGPGLASLVVAPMDPAAREWVVDVSLERDVPAGAMVNVLWKPFSARLGADWSAVAAIGSGRRFSARVVGGGGGALFAVEIVGGVGVGWRYPDVFAETPYVVLAPR